MRAVAKSFFSGDFNIIEGGSLLCCIDQSSFRERGLFDLREESYSLGRESGWGAFYLRQGSHEGRVLARADKGSAFTRSFALEIDGQTFEFTPPSAFTRRFELLQDGRVVGSIRPEGFFSRSVIAELPDEMPMPVRVFLVWIVLLMQRRQNSYNGST